MNNVLSFDIGTSSIKASLWSEKAECLAQTSESYPTFNSSDGIMKEQRPEDWWRCIDNVAMRLLQNRDDLSGIKGISLSGHSLGVVAVDEKGILLFDKTPIWSDARAENEADEFFKIINKDEWYYDTGCGFPAHLYGVFKIMYYKRYFPEMYTRTKCFLGSKDYINFLLTGVMATDRAYAAGSGVYSLVSECYKEKYIDAADIDGAKLPEIKEPDEVLGLINKQIAKKWGLNEDVKVVCGSVDNSCMCLGAGVINNGDSYASLGSSAWIAACLDTPFCDLKKGIYTFPHCIKGYYIPAAAIFSAGTSLEWVVKNIFNGEPDKQTLKNFDLIARTAPVGSNGTVFCPVMAGGSGVDESVLMKGGFYGLTLGTTKADMARSVLEGISCELALAKDAVEKNLSLSNTLKVVGGGALSEIWLEIYANVFQMRVERIKVVRSAAALGAAALAFHGLGVWGNYSILDSKALVDYCVSPDFGKSKNYKNIRRRFELVCKATATIENI